MLNALPHKNQHKDEKKCSEINSNLYLEVFQHEESDLFLETCNTSCYSCNMLIVCQVSDSGSCLPLNRPSLAEMFIMRSSTSNVLIRYYYKFVEKISAERL